MPASFSRFVFGPRAFLVEVFLISCGGGAIRCDEDEGCIEGTGGGEVEREGMIAVVVTAAADDGASDNGGEGIGGFLDVLCKMDDDVEDDVIVLGCL